jgi:WD40 repeat protein
LRPPRSGAAPDRNADDARHTLWSMRSQAAQAALVAGDGFRGLRPLVQNLAELEAAGRTADAIVERQRIGTVLANAPQLIDLFRFPQGTIVSSVAIAPDGKHFALATHGGRGQRRVRQYDLDGRELWSTATDGLTHVLPFDGMPHGPIRYTKDGSRIVVLLVQAAVIPAPTVSDAIALDARDGHVLAPPSELGHADIVWDGDARQALLRFRSDRSTRFPDSGQLFDAETWQPLGPRLPHGTAIGADEWLWSPDGKRLLGSSDFTRFTLFEPATLKPQLQFELPRGDPVRAWRFTPDGGQLALGTLTGTVYLVDTRTAVAPRCPPRPPRRSAGSNSAPTAVPSSRRPRTTRS